MMKQHKWHKEIKAWADGAEIEKTWTGFQSWTITETPEWQDSTLTFRIKPQPVEPQYLYVYKNGYSGEPYFDFREGLNENAGTYIGKIPLIVESNDE